MDSWPTPTGPCPTMAILHKQQCLVGSSKAKCRFPGHTARLQVHSKVELFQDNLVTWTYVRVNVI
jgi:hypothetical protein